jgi:hypothetical protein
MRQTIFSFLLITAIGLVSCRKDKIQLDIKQYDDQQIQNYIKANGLTDMIKDTSGGDTTGIYYKILNPGSGTPLDYPDRIAFVYTLKSFDGLYTSADTINNHFFDYVGHISADNLPAGIQIAVHNILKYPNASMRVLVPSHLAYGVHGSGSGSNTVANNKIKGNQCLDYYIHAVNNFQAYDDMVIKNYMTANNLTDYTPVTIRVPGSIDPILTWAGKANSLPYTATYYYKILTPGTSSDPITDASTFTSTYTGQLLNGSIFDGSHNGAYTAAFDINTLIAGVQDGLENHAVAGTKISLLLPSGLSYGLGGNTGIPSFSCLRFTWQILTVTP